MRPLTKSLVFLLTLAAVAAVAQEEQVSLKLNTPVMANQYLSVTDKPGLDGMTAMTIEAWVYPTSITGVQTIVGNDYQSSYWLGIVPTGNPTYPFKIRYYPTGGAGNFVEGVPADLQLNRWSHIAVTYDATVVAWRMLVNNVSIASGNSIPSPGPIGSSAGDLRIGADREGPNANYFFRGYLDEVRIWGAVKSSTELGNMWLTGAASLGYLPAPQYANLRAWWTMWGAVDVSGQFVFGDDHAYALAETFHNAYAVNGASPSLMAPPVDYNVGVRFQGAEYCQRPHTRDFSAGLTVEAWIAPAALTGYPTIVGRDYTSSFWLGITPAGNLRFYPTGGIGNYVQSVGAVSTTRWTHIAATYRDGTTRFYIDGALDSESALISGPVGDNGRVFSVGADNEAGGAAYFYDGFLDEVRVTNGELSPAQIRGEMFIGHDRHPIGARYVFDSQHIIRFQDMFSFGARHGGIVMSGSALRVRSGAPLTSPYGAGGGEADARSRVMDYRLEGFRTKVWSGLAPGTLPAGTNALTTLSGSLTVTETTLIDDVNVFVSLPTTALERTWVYLHHPDGTTITLLAPLWAAGRGLHTVFDDQSSITLESGFAPFADGVQPTFPLSALNGKPADGDWTVEVAALGAGDPSIGLWAFGLSINDALSAVGDGAQLPRGSSLRSLGGNPGSGAGTFEFELPAPGRTVLALYDLRGRLVSTLGNEIREAGRHRVHWNVPGLAAGIYFARLTVDGHEAGSLKITVMR